MPIDRNYMERALALAERARGRTAPNPMVGCVVVKNNRIIGEGFHASAGEPHAEVIAKCGMSLDGKIATRSGDSRWVTGEESRYRVHQICDQVDAILVGRRTIMLDDPSLTTRLPQRENRNPVRVLLDSNEGCTQAARHDCHSCWPGCSH